MKNEERSVPEHALIASLRDSQLKEVRLDRQSLSVSFHFTFGPEAQGFVLTFKNTVHVAISKTRTTKNFLLSWVRPRWFLSRTEVHRFWQN
jgi:hypothetical protein